MIPAALSGLGSDVDTDSRIEFAQAIKRVSDRTVLLEIKKLIDEEQNVTTLDQSTRSSNVYALGFVRDRLDWLDSDRRNGDLDPGNAPLTDAPDSSMEISKKAALELKDDKAPELLEVVRASPLYALTDADVEVGPNKTEPMLMPEHDHYANAFGLNTNVIGQVSVGQFATTMGNWFASPFRNAVGPFWAVAAVPLRDPFKPWEPRSIDPQGGFAAIERDAVVPFVITEPPLARTGFEPTNAALFPREPRPDDVHQGELADCGLLAILAGIAAREPWFIQQMMRDVGGGAVVVRLFDIAVGDDNGWTFTPRLVKIEKTVIMRDHQDLFAQTQTDLRGALWVPMIEKAYVGAGYLATTLARTEPKYQSMANLEGANLDFVFGHVRGEKADVTDIDQSERPGKGDRRKGVYSQKTLAWFERIDDALQDGKVVVLESGAKMTSKSGKQKTGFSGGEPQAQGLVGEHAYTVLGTASKGGRTFLRVRNPWGKYGRDYDFTAQKGSVVTENQDAGEFLLELNDATKRFTKVMISAS